MTTNILLLSIYFSVLYFQRYNVTVGPSRILPAALNLIDDYIIENKLNGLKSCLSILQCMVRKSLLNFSIHFLHDKDSKKNLLQRGH